MQEFKYISNIDTICILVDIEEYEKNSQNILNMLDEEKEKAKKLIMSNATYKHFIKIGNMNFELLTSGTKGYSFILQNSMYKLYLAKYPSKLPSFMPIQIRISSECLWSYGISLAWSSIYNWLVENFGNVCRESVCRLDLCTHTADIDFITNYDKTYKGVFKKTQIFKVNNSINAITFGSRQNKNIYCRIYNKTLEICEKSNKTWFYDIWKSNNIITDKDVWNIEFEIKSKLLRRFNIKTVNDVILHTRDLWEFCTKKWIVKIDLTATRRERCKTNEQWQKLQNAFIYLTTTGLIERERQINMDASTLIPNIAGFVTSYSARKDINDIDKTLLILKKEILKYYENKKTTFGLEVKMKNFKLRDCEVVKYE